MATHGGYRKPSKPAAVSGPGKYASRTDGQPIRDLPDAAYGEQADFQDIQSGAPMSDSLGAPPPGGGGFDFGSEPLPTGFDAPSEFPDAELPDFDNPPNFGGDVSADFAKVKKYVPLLAMFIDSPDMPDAARAMYQFLRDSTAGDMDG